MKFRSNRWVARLLLVAILFTQASVAFAACIVERSSLSMAFASEAHGATPSGMVEMTWYGPLNPNRCVAHCTADLQIPVVQVAIVRAASQTSVLLVPHAAQAVFRQTGFDSPAPGTPPPRVLLHAYLI